jgi:hypothetical protein
MTHTTGSCVCRLPIDSYDQTPITKYRYFMTHAERNSRVVPSTNIHSEAIDHNAILFYILFI